MEPGTDAPSDAAELSLERILDTIRRHVHVDLAYLARIEDDEQVIQAAAGDAAWFGLEPGTTLPLHETLCARVLARELPEVVPDTANHPATRSLELSDRAIVGSYIGVAVRRPDGSLLGTLCCASRAPDPTLSQHDAQFVRALATLIADHLELTRSRTEQRERLMSRLRRFIDGDGLEAHLQPIVDLTTGHVVGAEALARFDDGAPPFTWFGQAARVGLAVDLERSAMRAALAHLPSLPDDVYLSLNASPGTILSGGVHDVLAEAPPTRIVVEITEHAAIEDYLHVSEVLEPLIDRGVRLAIDDAGAGFASFRHVVQLSPDILKLDISLTRDVAQDPVQNSLAEMLAAFAQRIDAHVVAEGIETATTLHQLRAMGVGYGQGYLFERPAPSPLTRLDYDVT